MGQLLEDLSKSLFQSQTHCKKENARDVEIGYVAFTRGGLANAVGLPKISCEVKRLGQSGGHRLCSAVSCAHGEVARLWFGDSDVPARGKYWGSGV